MKHPGKKFSKWLVPFTMRKSWSSTYTLENLLAAWKQVGLLSPSQVDPTIPLSKLPLSSSSSTPTVRYARRVPDITSTKGGTPPAVPVARVRLRGLPTDQTALSDFVRLLSGPSRSPQPSWTRQLALTNAMRFILRELKLSVYGGAIRDGVGGYWDEVADIDVKCPQGNYFALCSFIFDFSHVRI
jgi:hypothetical protein